jgi:hypothetical protein
MSPNVSTCTADIFQQIVAACAPVRFQRPWGFLSCQSDCFGGIANCTAMLEMLRQQFGDAALQEAGVLQQPKDGPPLVHPGLTSGEGIVVLRPSPDAPPADLSTSHGCLSGLPPLFATAQDRWTQEAHELCPLFFAVFSLRDLRLLRSLGLPVALAAGLDQLNAKTLRLMAKAFDVSSAHAPDSIPKVAPASAAPDCNGSLLEGREAKTPQDTTSRQSCADMGLQSRRLLIIVGWSLSDLSLGIPGGVAPLARHLARAEESLDLDVENFAVWVPTPDEVEKIRFASQVRDEESLRRLVSHAQNLLEIQEFLDLAKPPDPKPPKVTEDYISLRRKLAAGFREQAQSGSAPPDLQQTWKRYEAQVRLELVEPLRRQALEAEDPALRCAGDELASLLELLHRLHPKMEQLMAREGRHNNTWEDAGMPPRLFEQYLQLSNIFRNMLREVMRCRTC